ncbi:MAG: hypothetical protein ABR597_08780 [Bacteroidales bacterium]
MTNLTDTSERKAIDALIYWVDGSDPKLSEKREYYLNHAQNINLRAAKPTFYASNNEIKYCVLSILKFAPFVRKIFIVTDNQDPGIHADIETNFPGRSNSVIIVDHKEIFRGYEKYLPVFNSTSILSMVWRIKNLSEQFVSFNDDIFLIREVKPEDWFVNGRPVLQGEWRIPPYKKMTGNFFKIMINKYLRGNPDYQPKLSFYLRQRNAALMLGFKFRYYFHCHTPHPLNRKVAEKFFSENNELLEKNISYRFRSPDQFLLTSLAYHLEILEGNRNMIKLNYGYLHPIYSKRRIDKKIKRCINDQNIKTVCAQNLDMFEKEERERIFSWLDNILGIR